MADKVELKVSRMDPMETYNAVDLAMQIMDHRKKATSLEVDAESFLKAAKIQRAKADELEILLTKVRARDRTRSGG